MGTSPARVVVLGGGFGGLYSALYLASADVPEGTFDITLVSAENYFTFTPLLAEVVGGGLTQEDVVSPHRVFAGRHGYRFRRARVEGIDTAGQLVHTSQGPIAFDYLIIALGAEPDYFGNDALRSSTVPFKSMRDAVAIRRRVLQMAERAAQEPNAAKRRALLSFGIVGAGPSGVEVASEIQHLLQRVLPRFYGVHEDPSVSILQGSDQILPGWDSGLAHQGLDLLRRRRIDVHLSTKVTGIEGRAVRAVAQDGAPFDVEAGTWIWTAGTTPSGTPFENSGLPRGPRGHLDVDRHLRVRGQDHIFAVGDVAQTVKATGDGYHPPVAPIAISAAVRAAGNIENAVLGRELEPYSAYHAGKIISLGGGAALVDLLGWRIGGVPAWLVYRMAYLLKLVGTKNKIRAVTSLTLNHFFDPALDTD